MILILADDENITAQQQKVLVNTSLTLLEREDERSFDDVSPTKTLLTPEELEEVFKPRPSHVWGDAMAFNRDQFKTLF